MPLSIPAWLSPRHSRGLCSIAALAVAVGGLGRGVSPALLHASFGPFCGPSECLCSLWDPCDPLCCLQHPNCRLWGMALQGQHLPHPHLCCCALAAAAARSPLGEVSLHGHCWCQQHRLMSHVKGSEREQMDFLGLMDQPPPGCSRVGARGCCHAGRAAVEKNAVFFSCLQIPALLTLSAACRE